MKMYKLSELKENTMYRCLLSDRPVLVNDVVTITLPKVSTTVTAFVYNDSLGCIEVYTIHDNMLCDYAK